MWLDLHWGLALLGIDPPAAAGHLAGAARSADRLGALHALDYTLRPLAIVAADSGLHEQAATLVAFTESQLRPHRIENPLQVWIQTQLNRALDSSSGVTPASPLHRRELLDVVTQIESALTQEASTSPFAPR